MVQHHPGAFIPSTTGLDPTDLPWALTTHLLSVSIPQFKRTTSAPFLSLAAQGRLPKPLIAEWLANDRLYIQGYISLAENLVRVIESTSGGSTRATRATATANPSADNGVEPIESRLLRWLDAAIDNVKREFAWFDEMTSDYGLTSPAPTSSSKSLGVQRFEALFSRLSSPQATAASSFLPWLEGAVCLFSTEKVYYEAWSWARRQDRRRSADGSARSRSRSPNPATVDYSRDLDGGAMRKEFIPNWSNKNFMMFVETLERIINEGVGEAVGKDEKRWQEVKRRADEVWQATLDAEEAFWPDVGGVNGVGGVELSEARGGREKGLLQPDDARVGAGGRGVGVDVGAGADGGKKTLFVPHVGNVQV